MRVFKPHIRAILKAFLITGIVFSLSACSSGGGDDEDDNQTSTNCVLGTSQIGGCKI